MDQPGLDGQPRYRCIKVPSSQGVEQIASEDDPLPLPPRKAFAYKMIDPALHRLSGCDPKSGAADLRILAHQPPVEPRRPLCRDLSLDTEIRSCGEREMLAPLRIVICPRLHNRARRSIAGHFDIG